MQLGDDRMINPFGIETEAPDEHTQPFISIESSSVATEVRKALYSP